MQPFSVDYLTGPHRGHGWWTLEPQQGGTKVTYTVSPIPHGLPARVLSHMVDFSAPHSRQMQGVLRGLAQYLSVSDAVV